MSMRNFVLVLAGAFITFLPVSAQSSPDIYEDDDDADQARPLTQNTVEFNHNIFPVGDQDWYSIMLDEPTTVTVEVNRRPVDNSALSFVRVFDSQLNEVECDDFSCDTEAIAIDLTAGLFYIVIEAFNDFETIPDYFVAISLFPNMEDGFEPDDIKAQATPLANAEISRDHSITPMDDDDWFSYQTLSDTENAFVVMEGNSSVRNISFDVFESDGTPVPLGTFAPQNRVFFNVGLLPDTYDIRVREWEREDGGDAQIVPNYQFTIWDISQPDPYEDDDTPATASFARVQGSDHTPAGHQQFRNIMPQGDVDWVRFYVEDADEVVVRAFATVGPGTTVAIYDEMGQTLLAGPDNSGFVDLDNPPDGYYLARISLAPSQALDQHLYDLDITSIPIPRLTQGTLAGTVVSNTKQTPVANANVTVSGPVSVSAATQSDGTYIVPVLPQGSYTVSASAPGFATGQQQANIGASVTAVNIALQPSDLPTDLNGDNDVNAVDVQLVINSALGLRGPADVNNDGETNAVDVQLVINAALGL